MKLNLGKTFHSSITLLDVFSLHFIIAIQKNMLFLTTVSNTRLFLQKNPCSNPLNRRELRGKEIHDCPQEERAGSVLEAV